MRTRTILDPRTPVGLYLPALISLAVVFAAGETLLLTLSPGGANLVETAAAVLLSLLMSGLVLALQALRRQSLLLKHANEVRQLSEQRYDLVVRGMAIGVWDWDVRADTLILSPNAQQILGVSDTNGPGSSAAFFDRVHPDETDTLTAAIQDHIDQGVPFSRDLRLKHADGHYVWCHLTGQALWTGPQEAIRLAGSIENITVEREGELARRQSEMRLRAVTQSAVDAVVATDAAGIILEANPACQTIFGHDPTGLIGENVRLLTPAEHSHKHDYYIRHYIETGASEIVGKVREVEGRHADGHAIPIELAVTEYREGEEHIFVATARDLSDRKQTEAEREAFIARLEASNAELERFSFAASHDLREPLRMIGSFSQMLNKRYADQLDADGRRALNICAQSASRMQALLDDLISFSRASDDLGQVETLLPADMIELARQNLAEEIERTAASFAIIHMPPAMRANPTRFLRVFQNLIANAIKYAKMDATPRIQISASPFEQGWLFTVSDNGIGMKPDYCEQIFEPFKRLHSPSEYSGTGMGLAICRKIVTAAGGRIWAESEPDKGSRFYVYWPDLEASDVADLAETKGEEA